MSNIPAKIRVKLQSVLRRIESGNFDASDIDALIINLRPYAGPQRIVFKEIAHFVAHADARNQGVTCDHITHMSDQMRFFEEHTQSRTRINLGQPFPKYIKRFLKAQALRTDEKILIKEHRLSGRSLANKIEKNFETDKETGLCLLSPGKGGKEFNKALNHILSTLQVDDAFKISDFHAQFLHVLTDLGIPFDRNLLERQSDRISLIILCLVGGTSFALPGDEIAKCHISSDSGTLGIIGSINVKCKNGIYNVQFPVISTSLITHENCDPSLLKTWSESNEFGTLTTETFEFTDDMAVTSGFKLVSANGAPLT